MRRAMAAVGHASPLTYVETIALANLTNIIA
nr:MAG TPA: hypothetical protein [Caudoviricetes sp.]